MEANQSTPDRELPVEVEPVNQTTPPLLDSSVAEAPVTKTPFYKHQNFAIYAVVAVLLLLSVGVFAYSFTTSSSDEQALASPNPITTATHTPTPSVVASSLPVAFTSPSPSTSPKATASPTVSPTPAASPASVLAANLYYQTVTCDYPEQPGSNGSPMVPLHNKVFTTSNVPDNTSCAFIIQNSESTKTGEIEYVIKVDGTVVERVTAGALAKGNWPNSDYLTKTHAVLLPKTVGLHQVEIVMNPDKKFSETNFNDNTYLARYTVN
ncbi:MAG: hypothetical protein M3Q81_03905 [bacterium]|nr:hypothetical protein [bacterium]